MIPLQSFNSNALLPNSYPPDLFHKLILRHLHNVKVSPVAVPVKCEVVRCQLLQNEQQQLIVIVVH